MRVNCSIPTRSTLTRSPRIFTLVVATLLIVALAFFAAPSSRAEYVVLRSGLRLNVTGYQLIGNTYRLQLNGGTVEVPAEEVSAIEPEVLFTPIVKPVIPTVSGPFAQFINSAATRFKVDPDLIHSVIAIESNYNPKAISRRHAGGLMQLIPGTAAQMGVRNIFDPRENIDGGTRYLGELLHRYDNNLVLTLAAYNAGPQSVQKYGRVPPFAETISYVRKVQHNYEQRKSKSKAKAKTPTQPPA
jgi:hypothetical protein